jgi:hypothetical protein
MGARVPVCRVLAVAVSASGTHEVTMSAHMHCSASEFLLHLKMRVFLKTGTALLAMEPH